ncbi:hypothetical protein ABH945_007281 [Paraburkholderia sp. GAS333]
MTSLALCYSIIMGKQRKVGALSLAAMLWITTMNALV